MGAEGEGGWNGKTCRSLRGKDAELEGGRQAWSCWEKRGAGFWMPRLKGSFPTSFQQSGGRGGRQQRGEGEGGGKDKGGAHSGIELVFPVFRQPPGNKFGSCYFSLATSTCFASLQHLPGDLCRCCFGDITVHTQTHTHTFILHPKGSHGAQSMPPHGRYHSTFPPYLLLLTVGGSLPLIRGTGTLEVSQIAL